MPRKRSRGRRGNSGKRSNVDQQATAPASSPKLDDSKITHYFPASEGQLESSPDKQTSDLINPGANIGISTCADVVPGLLTPDSTPTKTPIPPDRRQSPSPDATLPYPLEEASPGNNSISMPAGDVGKRGGEQLGPSVDSPCPTRRTSPRKGNESVTDNAQSFTLLTGDAGEGGGEQLGPSVDSPRPARRTSAQKAINFFANNFQSVTEQSGKDSGRQRKFGDTVESPVSSRTETGPKKSRRGRRGRKAGAKSGTPKAHSTQKRESETRVKTIKDFFPVRRSDRRCKSELEAEKKEALEDAILSNREDGLKVDEILGKGRGVISTKPFKRGDFVVEYYGDLISMPEARQREAKYQEDPETGCYMYYFEHKNRSYCVDATRESGRLGRLLNHSRQGNCCTKLIDIKERPHLILVAKQDIEAGEELVYDYGDRNKESIQSHPWLAL
ncbi:uncharacterized protein [Diadema antillarum]|uniref:uncharacterized protein n=1 Tax=Diadema antillarum TaxID=105358 RepID=UPI003A8A0AFF